MTLVFGTREVSAGPTVGLQLQGGDVGASSPDAYVSKQITTEHKLRRVSCFLEIGETLVVEREEKTCQPVKPVVSLKGKSVDDLTEESDDSSSSTVDDGEEEVQSKFNGAFSSMGSLEESLPIKRGLSNFYSGKSKSFANLSEITKVTDLVKQENPFNKRRRTLIACKWSRRTFCSSINLTLKEDEDEEV